MGQRRRRWAYATSTLDDYFLLAGHTNVDVVGGRRGEASNHQNGRCHEILFIIRLITNLIYHSSTSEILKKME